MNSFKSAVSDGHTPVQVEITGVSVTLDSIVGCKVLVGDGISVVGEHAESIIDRRIVPMIFFIIFSDL